ncbi:MAG: peroxiredoxin [bacterium]
MSIQVGKRAPEFKLQALVNNEFRDVSLSDYSGRWVVLFFYPLDFTFVCPTEITEFADKKAQFEKLNAVVLGCSTDSVFSHQAWVREGTIRSLNYPLLSDQKHEISRDYGVLIEEAGIALRGCFIIDPDGVLRYQLVHDLGVGRSVDEILRVLLALQTGDLCQASWKPGQKTLGK